MEGTISRYAPLAGVLFPLLVVVGFAIEGSSPSTDDSPAEIVAFYVDNDVQVKIGSALAAVAAMFAVVFATRVATAMRDRGGSRLLAWAAVAGGAVTAAGVGVDSAFRFALADAAGDISPEAAQAVFTIWSGFFWPMHLGLALLVLAASLSSLDTKMLPSWLAGLGLVGVVLIVIPVLPVLIAGLVVLLVWVLASSVLLFRGQGELAAKA